MPAVRLTRQVNVPFPATGVDLLTPGPTSTKLWIAARSRTVMTQAPGFSCFAAAPAIVFRPIVKPGPTVPTSVATSAARATDGATSPVAERTAARSRRADGIRLTSGDGERTQGPTRLAAPAVSAGARFGRVVSGAGSDACASVAG